MLSMILQWVHPALAADGHRALPQEQKPGSNRSSRPDAKKVDKEIAMVDRLRLHARPAALFARSANRFCANVWLEKERPNFSLSPSRLTRSKFRLARLLYRFAVISPVLWLIGSLVFSFCLLLAAFNL